MTADNLYRVHTVEDGGRDSTLFADGKKSGHGTIAWLSAPSYEMQPAPSWPPTGRSPVIALLDSGVQPHSWLPELVTSRPFLIDAATEYGWNPPDAIPGPGDDFGSHWGHATFLAGLIRLAAPEAQILSVQVMDKMGQVSEKNVVAALTLLADHIADLRIDVVLMAFGRQADAGDDGLKNVRDALGKLADHQVKFVASAGNQGTEQLPVWPAAFATTNPELSVVSVGARVSATERAPYSDYGVWVREWEQGTNVVSIMPLMTKEIDGAAERIPGSGFAYWTGTSFAAASYAGALARRMAAERLPAQVTGR